MYEVFLNYKLKVYLNNSHRYLQTNFILNEVTKATQVLTFIYSLGLNNFRLEIWVARFPSECQAVCASLQTSVPSCPHTLPKV